MSGLLFKLGIPLVAISITLYILLDTVLARQCCGKNLQAKNKTAFTPKLECWFRFCKQAWRVSCSAALQAAMQYTEAQQQDLMLLRRLFYGKLGVLARQRKQCLHRVPLEAAMTDSDVNSRLAEVVTTAQELRDITAAEFQTKLQLTSAYRRGVSSLPADHFAAVSVTCH